MKIADILMVTLVAGATMTTTLALMWPTPLSGDNPKPDTHPIAQPQLEIDGCVLTLASAKPRFEAGEEVILLLHATNTTDRAVAITPEVQVVEVAPNDPMSRVMRMPVQVFKQPCTLTLDPGKESVMRIATKCLAKPGNAYRFVLADGAKQLWITGFTMPGATTAIPPRGPVVPLARANLAALKVKSAAPPARAATSQPAGPILTVDAIQPSAPK